MQSCRCKTRSLCCMCICLRPSSLRPLFPFHGGGLNRQHHQALESVGTSYAEAEKRHNHSRSKIQTHISRLQYKHNGQIAIKQKLPCRFLIDSLLITMKIFLYVSERNRKSYNSTSVYAAIHSRTSAAWRGKRSLTRLESQFVQISLNPLHCVAGSREGRWCIVGDRDGARCAADYE